MPPEVFNSSRRISSGYSGLILLALVALVGTFTAGCGGSVSSSTGSNLSGSTAVTVLATSTANAQLTAFFVDLEGISLTNKAGKTVTLLSTPLYTEFVHLNGQVEPLATATIPQDTYMSATVTVGTSLFTCIGLQPSGNLISAAEFSDKQVNAAQVTVTLPQPITVTGTSMGVALNLAVPQSASYPAGCSFSGIPVFSITPNFTLSAVPVAAQPTNAANGKAAMLFGTVSAVNANQTQVTVTGADGSAAGSPVWNATINSNTIFQGIGGVGQLALGIPVEVDASLQQDGSLLAARIAVPDTNATNATIFAGPIFFVADFATEIDIYNTRMAGYLDEEGILPETGADYSNAQFKISGAMSNLATLPFAASFTAANMAPGQNVSMTTHSTNNLGGLTPVNTVTLIPQTLDGKVSAVATEGGFTKYTIQLASYDLFPVAAVEEYHISPLATPNVVVVYADGNTQNPNSTPVAVGSVARFYGLVFNDNGTLRMDCEQINSGVTL